MTLDEIKQKFKTIVDQFDTFENGYIKYEQLLSPNTLIIDDDVSFFIDNDLISHPLKCEDTFDFNTNPYTGDVLFYDIKDYVSTNETDIQIFDNENLKIYVNTLNNSKYNFFVEDNNLYKTQDEKIILCIFKNENININDFFSNRSDIAGIECNAFRFIAKNNVSCLNLSKLSSLKFIPDYLFECKCFFDSLKKIILPENIYFIGESAFKKCHQLSIIESVNNFLNLSAIGHAAFEQCSSLVNINFQDSNLIKINVNAFKDCNTLTMVVVPNSLSFIGSHAFENCISLSNVNIEDTQISSLTDGQFINCSSLTSLHCPSSLNFFSTYAVESCINLTQLEFQDCNDIKIFFNDIVFINNKNVEIYLKSLNLITELSSKLSLECKNIQFKHT